MKRHKCWTYTAGAKGHTVTVYERTPGGPLSARCFDQSLRAGRGGYRRLSLGHRDQERAKTYALEQAAKLRNGRADVTAGHLTLAKLFAAYATHRTPRKTPREQSEDRRRTALWTCTLGALKDPHLISLGEWETFIDARRSGAIDARGESVATPSQRRPVRTRPVQADCVWLRRVLSWGTKWRDGNGHYLLKENAVRGYDIPEDKNIRRPVASTDRYTALRAVADRVHTGQGSHEQRCYLGEMLDLAYWTGRRIGAVRQLRYEDLRLERTTFTPHGSIVWPAVTDKMGNERRAPLSQQARHALDRVLADRPGIGAAYLFPAPRNREQPVSYAMVRRWLLQAERLAKLPRQEGTAWHALRRGFAVARKHLPPMDVAAAGGWANAITLQNVYQQADPGTMLRAVTEAAEVREA